MIRVRWADIGANYHKMPKRAPCHSTGRLIGLIRSFPTAGIFRAKKPYLLPHLSVAASSAARGSTQRVSPVAVTSCFQKGALVFR